MFVAFVLLFCILGFGGVILSVLGAQFGATVAFSAASMLAGVGYPTWRNPGSSYFFEPLFWIGAVAFGLAVVLGLGELISQLRAEFRAVNRYKRR